MKESGDLCSKVIWRPFWIGAFHSPCRSGILLRRHMLPPRTEWYDWWASHGATHATYFTPSSGQFGWYALDLVTW